MVFNPVLMAEPFGQNIFSQHPHYKTEKWSSFSSIGYEIGYEKFSTSSPLVSLWPLQFTLEAAETVWEPRAAGDSDVGWQMWH